MYLCEFLLVLRWQTNYFCVSRVYFSLVVFIVVVVCPSYLTLIFKRSRGKCNGKSNKLSNLINNRDVVLCKCFIYSISFSFAFVRTNKPGTRKQARRFDASGENQMLINYRICTKTKRNCYDSFPSLAFKLDNRCARKYLTQLSNALSKQDNIKQSCIRLDAQKCCAYVDADLHVRHISSQRVVVSLSYCGQGKAERVKENAGVNAIPSRRRGCARFDALHPWHWQNCASSPTHRLPTILMDFDDDDKPDGGLCNFIYQDRDSSSPTICVYLHCFISRLVVSRYRIFFYLFLRLLFRHILFE